MKFNKKVPKLRKTPMPPSSRSFYMHAEIFPKVLSTELCSLMCHKTVMLVHLTRWKPACKGHPNKADFIFTVIQL